MKYVVCILADYVESYTNIKQDLWKYETYTKSSHGIEGKLFLLSYCSKKCNGVLMQFMKKQEPRPY